MYVANCDQLTNCRCFFFLWDPKIEKHNAFVGTRVSWVFYELHKQVSFATGPGLDESESYCPVADYFRITGDWVVISQKILQARQDESVPGAPLRRRIQFAKVREETLTVPRKETETTVTW